MKCMRCFHIFVFISVFGIIPALPMAAATQTAAVVSATELPADATMNKDAGRGNLLFVTLRLESGEELPFFLDTDRMDATQLGKAFPLVFRQGCPFMRQSSLVGGEGTNLLVDAGYRGDGALKPGLFQREIQKLQSEGNVINGQHAGRI